MSGYVLDLFSTVNISFVERLLLERGDNASLSCQMYGKDVVAKPEEIVHQLWINPKRTTFAFLNK